MYPRLARTLVRLDGEFKVEQVFGVGKVRLHRRREVEFGQVCAWSCARAVGQLTLFTSGGFLRPLSRLD
jgi:hypothetical protein